jgi:hypothetical protein
MLKIEVLAYFRKDPINYSSELREWVVTFLERKGK